jgi:AAA family ATP:ADP antiporter
MISKFISPFFNKIINVNQDEYRKVVLLQFTIFLVISVLMILKPLGTSLMLTAYGMEIMPLAFVCIAVAAVIIHFLLLLLRRYWSLIQAININFIFHIIVFLALAVASHLNMLTGWLTLVTYVYISLFSVITVTLFFQYTHSLLSIREAKRVLSYIGVAAIAGGVFGGYFASAMVSYFGNIGLLLAAVVFLILAYSNISIVHRHYGSDLEQDSANMESLDRQLVKTIKNKHVAFIALIIGSGVMASKLLDYQFNDVVYSYYLDKDEMTAFLGFWFSSINAVGLIVQLFLVNPLIDRLGVTNSMSIMPIMILLSLVAFMYFPILAVGAAMKMVDGSLKQSIYKTSTEINFMPLSTHLRERAKTLVDVVIDSIATGLSGVLIFILINKVTLPVTVITLVTFIIVLAWVTFIMLSKKTYLKQLSNLVYKEDDHDEEIVITPTQYLQQLLSKKPRKSKSRFRALVKLTKNSESPIKSAAIEAVSLEYKYRGLSLISHLRNDKSMLVRKKFFEEKIKFINTKSELDELYESTTPKNRIILTGALARSLGYKVRQQQKFYTRKRIDQAYSYLNNHDVPKILWRTWMTSVTDSRYEKYYSIIIDKLGQSHDEDMKMHALFAIGRGRVVKLFPHVVECYITSHNRQRWYKTLAKFPKRLLACLEGLPVTKSKQLKRLLPALQYINKQTHLDFLFKTIEHPKRRVRITALRTIGMTKNRYPYLNYQKRKNTSRLNGVITQTKKILGEIALMHELIDKNSEDPDKIKIINEVIVILKNELSINMHLIFVLLGLVIESDDTIRIYSELKSGNTQAPIDYLDQLMPYKIKKQLFPIIELVLSNDITEKSLQQKDIKMLRKDKAVTYLRNLDPTVYEDLIKLM